MFPPIHPQTLNLHYINSFLIFSRLELLQTNIRDMHLECYSHCLPMEHRTIRHHRLAYRESGLKDAYTKLLTDQARVQGILASLLGKEQEAFGFLRLWVNTLRRRSNIICQSSLDPQGQAVDGKRKADTSELLSEPTKAPKTGADQALAVHSREKQSAATSLSSSGKNFDSDGSLLPLASLLPENWNICDSEYLSSTAGRGFSFWGRC